jgi:hypothetical protein
LKGSGSANFKLTVSVRFSFDRSRVGDLKSAFLAAFAMFGYRYAYSQRLDLVRRQIMQPDDELIDSAWWTAGPALTEDPMLMVMKQPFPGVLVRLRSVLVALPWITGPDDFYAAVRQAFSAGSAATQTLDILRWPTSLHMLGDYS